MGLFSSLFGGSGAAGKTGVNALKDSFFTPYSIKGSFGGINSTAPIVPTKRQWRQGMRPTPGTFSANLSPEMEALRSLFMGGAASNLQQAGQGVPGYAGITPELMREFGLSNYDMDQLGAPNVNIRDFYAPETPDNPMQDFLGAARGYLGQEAGMQPYDLNAQYQERLNNMRALDAPLEDRLRYGNFNDQFGRGIMDSTGGSYQTEGVERALAAKDLMRHDSAWGQSIAGGDFNTRLRQMLQNAALGMGGAAGNLGLGYMDRQLQGQQLGIGRDAEQGGLNLALQQLLSGQVGDRFKRAMEMFGTGQEAQTLAAGRAGGLLGNVGGIDQFLANLMQLSGNLGSQRSGANISAYSPLMQARFAQDRNANAFAGQLVNAGMGYLGGLGGFSGGGGGGGLGGPTG